MDVVCRLSLRTEGIRYLIDELLGMPRALDDASSAFSAGGRIWNLRFFAHKKLT
ncbi:MAG: hypothetical protein HG456_001985 [candidate division SR1 bacterium]|nr:hypothetical protein [candidate division SR1 bacterium]